MTKRRLKWAIAAAAVTIALYVVYSAVSIWTYGSVDRREPTDAAIVLGAAVWDGKPSPVLEERIRHAIELYESGAVNKIIFTGGRGEGEAVSEAMAAKRYAEERGVPSADLYIEEISRITLDNLVCAREIARQEGLQTFTIVSDPLHMKRSVTMAQDLGLTVYSSPTPTSVYKSARTKVPFLLRELFFYVGYKVLPKQAVLTNRSCTEPIDLAVADDMEQRRTAWRNGPLPAEGSAGKLF